MLDETFYEVIKFNTRKSLSDIVEFQAYGHFLNLHKVVT